MKKIHIIGNTGSGKSTISRHLSEKLSINHYEMDDIFFAKKYSVERPHPEKIAIAQDICKKDSWVCEGVQRDFTLDLIKNADIVFHVSTNKYICFYRIVKRCLKNLMKGKWYVLQGFGEIVKYSLNPPNFKEVLDEHAQNYISVTSKEQALNYINSQVG